MNESKKRTLLLTVIFSFTVLCLLTTFSLQMRMKSTLAQIAAVQVTQVQTSPVSSAPVTEPTTASEPESAFPSESVRAIVSEKPPTSAAAKTTASPVKNDKTAEAEKTKQLSEQLVVNTNTKKIHSPDCSFAKNIKPENRAEITAGDLQGYLENGYTLCGHCEGCAK